MNRNQVELKREIESKLDQAERVYNDRNYCFDFNDKKHNLSHANKIKRLGYKVSKMSNGYMVRD